jgi:CoA transferase family III
MRDLITSLPDKATYAVSGNGVRSSAFAVSELATASVAAVGTELAGLIQALNLATDAGVVTVDHRLASHWFGYSFRPQGWDMPNLWDSIAGDYETADGWIRLHTNLPQHRAATLRVLGCSGTRNAVVDAVRLWRRDALEDAIVAENGVAAAMRSRIDWLAHPQGHAVSQDPLIGWRLERTVSLRDRPACIEKPLAGLRVLDLTRVLAGPIATRTLAGFGADVLRVDPPGWDEPGVIPDISLGKRCVYLDLTQSDHRSKFETLLADADILVHGYRPGALDGLGYGLSRRDELAPNRIEVTLDAYGWQGPWAQRRGFDSLVQMSAGIADSGRIWANAVRPSPLPVQALDHATGYLMAAAVLSALSASARGDNIAIAHLSLARTAELLSGLPKSAAGGKIDQPIDADFAPSVEFSGWGPGHRLKPPLSIGGTKMAWTTGAAKLGTGSAVWA